MAYSEIPKLPAFIHKAIREGNLEIVKTLEEINAEENNRTALYYALLYKKTKIVKYLFEKGCTTLGSGLSETLSPVELATINHDRRSLQALMNITTEDSSALGKALRRAAMQGNTEIIEAILEHLPELTNQQNKFGETALHHAARYKQNSAMALLINKGADQTITNNYGKTAQQVYGISFEAIREARSKSGDYHHTSLVLYCLRPAPSPKLEISFA